MKGTDEGVVEDLLCFHGRDAGRGHGTVIMLDLAWPFSKAVLLSSGLCPLALLAAGVLLELISSFLALLAARALFELFSSILALLAGTFTGFSFSSPDPLVLEQQYTLRHIKVKHMPPQKDKLHKAKRTTDVCSMLTTEVEGWLFAVCREL